MQHKQHPYGQHSTNWRSQWFCTQAGSQRATKALQQPSPKHSSQDGVFLPSALVGATLASTIKAGTSSLSAAHTASYEIHPVSHHSPWLVWGSTGKVVPLSAHAPSSAKEAQGLQQGVGSLPLHHNIEVILPYSHFIVIKQLWGSLMGNLTASSRCHLLYSFPTDVNLCNRCWDLTGTHYKVAAEPEPSMWCGISPHPSTAAHIFSHSFFHLWNLSENADVWANISRNHSCKR